MGTRCTVTVRDTADDPGFSIYRHYDGYPNGEHGVLAGIQAALPFAWRLPRFEASEFAAALVRAWKEGPRTYNGATYQGGTIYLSHGRDAHGDTDYHYEIVPRCENGRFVALDVSVFARDSIRDEWVWETSCSVMPAVPVRQEPECEPSVQPVAPSPAVSAGARVRLMAL